jgi:hypothetical protein
VLLFCAFLGFGLLVTMFHINKAFFIPTKKEDLDFKNPLLQGVIKCAENFNYECYRHHHS